MCTVLLVDPDWCIHTFLRQQGQHFGTCARPALLCMKGQWHVCAVFSASPRAGPSLGAQVAFLALPISPFAEEPIHPVLMAIVSCGRIELTAPLRVCQRSGVDVVAGSSPWRVGA